MTESKETTSAKSERLHHLEQTVNNLQRVVIKSNKKAKRTRDNGSSVVGPVIPTGGINMEEHDLFGPWHRGSFDRSQGPEFLLVDGSRPLAGNMSVDENVTIDGVDISSLGVEFIYHRDTTADVHNQYAAAMGSSFDHKAKTAEWSDWATNLNRSIYSGQGLKGGGLLERNHTLSIDYDIIHTWNEIHTFNQGLNSGNLMPLLPDTNDIGSEINRWRSAYISELKAVVLAIETTTALGGYFMVTKDAGKLDTKMTAAQTTYDFGKAMTTDDIILLRHMFVMEYIKIGTVVSGTAFTYNITRNLDGTGASDWDAGLPYVVLGQNGDGWIELSAYGSPRQSFMLQGTAYNLRDEIIRIGDLSNWDGASLTGKKGIAIGKWDTGTGPYLIYNPTDGLTVKGSIKADTGYLKDLSIDGVLMLGANGLLVQGTGFNTGANWYTNFTGTAIWNTGGFMKMGGWNAGVKQWEANSDGTLLAGAGAIKLNAIGIHLYSSTLEHVRIGDLNGQWGYTAATYGVAFGNYTSGKANITIDPTNGVRIRNHNDTVIQLNGTQATFENTIYLGAAGKLIQGTGTWGTNFTGSAIWAEPVGSNLLMSIGGWYAGTKQWWGNSEGRLTAAAGNLIIDENGLSVINSLGGSAINRRLRFVPAYTGTITQYSDTSDITGFYSSPYNSMSSVIRAYCNKKGSTQWELPDSSLYLLAKTSDQDGSNYVESSITIVAKPAAKGIGPSAIEFVTEELKSYATLNYFGDTRITQTLSVSGTSTLTGKVGIGRAPSTGDWALAIAGNTYLGGNATITGTLTGTVSNANALGGIAAANYGRPVFLTTPLTSTDFAGGTKTNTNNGIVDLSVKFGVPAGIKAVSMTIQCTSATANQYIRFGPTSTYNYSLTARIQAVNVTNVVSGIVPCDANGDIYMYVASGHTILQVYVWIWGYWL